MKKFIVVLSAIFIIFLLKGNIVTEEIIIPNEAIRIRVIANSNSIDDQLLKNKVKSSVQKKLNLLLKEANNVDEVRKILNENLSDIKYTVEKELKNTTNNKFDVNFGYNYFPQKTYKGVNYKEGYYESIVIKLGNFEGNNWWCVLFPPLCMIDETEEEMESVEYKSFVKEIIDKYF